MDLGRAIGSLPLSLVLCLVASSIRAQDQGVRYEEPPTRNALEVLPEWMVNGDYWTVADEVSNFEGLHEFTVRSEWGDFEVYGEPMLRIRLKELTAIGALKEQKFAKVAAGAAVEGAVQSVERTVEVVKHPIKTVKSLPKGIARMFKKIVYDVGEVTGDVADVGGEIQEGESGEPGKKAGQAAFKYGKRFVGVELQERIWAQKLGIDPYTTNGLLRQQLTRVASIDAGAKLGVSFINPIAKIGVISTLADVYQVVWIKDHRELAEWIYLELLGMGAEPKFINHLLYSDALPPGHLTLFVAVLKNLEGVISRHTLVEQAAMLETEAEGLFFLECAVMAYWYHQNQAPLEKFLPGTLIPVGMTLDGRVIAFSAADWAYWTPETAQLAAEFTEVYDDYSDQREAWISDRISPAFLAGMRKLGWNVRAGVRTIVLPYIPWGLGNELVRGGIPDDPQTPAEGETPGEEGVPEGRG